MEQALGQMEQALERLGALERRPEASVIDVGTLDADATGQAAVAVDRAITQTGALAGLVIETFGSDLARQRFARHATSGNHEG